MYTIQGRQGKIKLAKARQGRCQVHMGQSFEEMKLIQNDQSFELANWVLNAGNPRPTPTAPCAKDFEQRVKILNSNSPLWEAKTPIRRSYVRTSTIQWRPYPTPARMTRVWWMTWPKIQILTSHGFVWMMSCLTWDSQRSVGTSRKSHVEKPRKQSPTEQVTSKAMKTPFHCDQTPAWRGQSGRS